MFCLHLCEDEFDLTRLFVVVSSGLLHAAALGLGASDGSLDHRLLEPGPAARAHRGGDARRRSDVHDRDLHIAAADHRHTPRGQSARTHTFP